MAPNSASANKTYSEHFVTALIASFLARDGKLSIDNASVAEYLAMLGESKTPSAIEHTTRNMKNKAKILIAEKKGEAVPVATPRKRNAKKGDIKTEEAPGSPTKKARTRSGAGKAPTPAVQDEDEDDMLFKKEQREESYGLGLGDDDFSTGY